MRYQDVRMLSDAIQGYRDNVLRKKMMEQQEEQRQLENQMRQEMAALQKQRYGVEDARWEKEFGRRATRDGIEDDRWNKGWQRTLAIDQRDDGRYAADRDYRLGRDRVADERYATERGDRLAQQETENIRGAQQLNLGRMQAMLSMANQNRGYDQETLDDMGNVIGRVRRTPIGSAQQAVVPMNNVSTGSFGIGSANMAPLGSSAPTQPTGSEEAAPAIKPPPAAIDFLNKNKNDPATLRAFQAKYGVDPRQFLR